MTVINAGLVTWVMELNQIIHYSMYMYVWAYNNVAIQWRQ